LEKTIVNTQTALSSTTRINAGLALLRVIIGVIFVAHGGQKLFAYGLDGVTGAFQQMGVPMATFMAPLITGIELVGGLALILGFFTRIAGVSIAVTMLGALVMVHLAGGFFAPTGIEYTLALFAAALALALVGPGSYSLDAVVRHREVRSDFIPAS
jgi:putative oxidoreductase